MPYFVKKKEKKTKKNFFFEFLWHTKIIDKKMDYVDVHKKKGIAL